MTTVLGGVGVDAGIVVIMSPFASITSLTLVAGVLLAVFGAM